MEDGQLLRDYAENGSEAAFTALVDRHLDLVYSTALRRLGDPHAAEEVAQSVFCLLASKARRFQTGAALAGWLYRTACFKASKFLRSECRRRAREQEAAHMNSDHSDSDPLWQRLALHLDGAMNQLGDQERLAILLRFFQQRSLREVGAALGTSEDAARMRVNRALEKLREILAGKGVASSSAALGALLAERAVVAAPARAAQSVQAVALQAAKLAGGTSLLATLYTLMAKAKLRTAGIAAAGLLLVATVGPHFYHKAQEQALNHTPLADAQPVQPATQPAAPRFEIQRSSPGEALAESSAVAEPAWAELRKILYSPVDEGGFPSSDLRVAIDRLKSSSNEVVNVLLEAFRQGQEGNALPAKRALAGLGHMRESAAQALPALWEFLHSAGASQYVLRDSALWGTLPWISPRPELARDLIEYFRTKAIIHTDPSADHQVHTDLSADHQGHKAIGREHALSELVDHQGEKTILRDQTLLDSVHTALRTLITAQRKQATEISAILASYLSDQDADVRLLVAGALAYAPELYKALAVPELIGNLNEPSQSERHLYVLMWLKQFGLTGGPAAPEVEQFIASTTNQELRRFGAEALAAITPPRNQREQESPAERSAREEAAALENRVKTGRASVSECAAALTNARVRVRAAQSLCAKGSKAAEALPALHAVLQTDGAVAEIDEVFRDLVALTIKQIDPDSPKPLLTNDDITPAVRAVAEELEATASPLHDSVLEQINQQMRKLSFTHEQLVAFAEKLGQIDGRLRNVFVAKLIEFDSKLASVLAAEK